MAVLRWDRTTWREFEQAIEAYQREFSGRAQEDPAYLRCFRLLGGKTRAARAAKSRDITRFLNDWKCGVNRQDTPLMLVAWIRENAERLDALVPLTISEPEVLEQLDEIQAVYDTCGSPRAPGSRDSWGPAGNAKTLHQLIPGLFVMWDKNIVPLARDYSNFLAEMQSLAVRLIEESPYASAQELDGRMQEHLGYNVPKTLAKYLDEFNWYEMVGAGRVARRG